MNKAIITGRVTAQPKMQQAGDLQIAKYSLAVERKKRGEVDFINIVAFGKQAEFAEKYLTKGMKIGVSGRIQTGSWKAQDGSTRHSFDIVAEEVEFLQNKSENSVQSVEDGFVPSPTSTTGTRVWEEATQEELPFV